jgi:UDP-N-acetylmuramoylalanine--D-glutamate ligase
MTMRKKDFAGRIILVMGLGRFGGGVDAAEFAAQADAKVIITDSATVQQLGESVKKLNKYPNIEFHLGSHDPADFEKADIIIANPAIPLNNKFLEIARKAGKIVTSQINIFFELCPAQIIGITGANGKSTTTSLTAHLLEKTKHEMRDTKYERVWLGGNIGNQPMLTIIDKIHPDDLVVLELSSFQIEQLAGIKKSPRIALLTNLTPNHLDRYGTFEKYCAAKETIFKYQELSENNPAVSIFNAEDKIAAEWFNKYKNDKGRICIKFSADDVAEQISDCYELPGRANRSNLAAAMAIAGQFGVDEKSIKKTLPGFKALPHRLELVKEINGVRWYNDSKATTPEGAITALNAFEQPIIIIAGGYDKGLPFDEFGEKIAEKTKAAILIGKTAPKIAEAIKRGTRDEGRETKVQTVKSLDDAVHLANSLVTPGDVVLLSPACASYDMFENYEQRGNIFSQLVKSLNAKNF